MKVTDQDLHEQMLGITINLPNIGDYVFATKFNDGDPGDAWALGFYAGAIINYKKGICSPRYKIVGSDGLPLRGNGYGRIKRIRKDVGNWLLNVVGKQLEQSPPGTVNLWTMLTESAFDLTLDKG